MKALRRLMWDRVTAPADDRDLLPLVTAGLATLRPLAGKQAQFRITAKGALTLYPELAT